MSEALIGVFVNAETDETIERELTADELSYLQSIQDEQQKLDAEAQAKDKARASALAKLKKLGLTDKEIAAL